ncbi:fungal-specific transcription factor domain-containing protein [Apiospora rasikravindrae]|uniref:Fungal-specific transcription factor domain-containing protein n=1 Tax=Apiospora rasikravindrae TaxID=990691 RepID=A0ABR1TDC4_9PEZI
MNTRTGEAEAEYAPQPRKNPGFACVSCDSSGAECVVRSNCPPRGPKKGYLKSLQQKIEELQKCLSRQREEEAAASETRDKSVSRGTSDIDDNKEDEAQATEMTFHETDAQYAHVLAATSTSTAIDTDNLSSDVRPWSAFMTTSPSSLLLQQPWENIDHMYTVSSFPVLETQSTPLPEFEAESYLTLMMRNDLRLTPSRFIQTINTRERDQLYFDRLQQFAPIVQKYRYYKWSREPEKSKQRRCLQYAMWSLAASFSSQFHMLRSRLYREARQLLDAIEVAEEQSGEDVQSIPLEQIQAGLLLALYGLTSDVGNYQRAITLAGGAFRQVQMMRLHEIDKPNGHGALAQSSPGQQMQGDWIDVESMRRTFWLAYTIDHFTSVIDDLHPSFDEKKILTRLPAPDEFFTNGRPVTMCFLSDIMYHSMDSAAGQDCPISYESLSPFSETIVVATIWARTVEHQLRPPHLPLGRHHSLSQLQLQLHHLDRNRDATYEFCRRHQSLVTMLTQNIKALRTRVHEHHMDPLLHFAILAACVALLKLYETIEATPLGHEAQAIQLTESLLLEHKQKALDAMQELHVLVGALGQLNHFQTHPFTPIPLLLGARFCQKHIGLTETCTAITASITAALQELSTHNGLALRSLKMLISDGGGEFLIGTS